MLQKHTSQNAPIKTRSKEIAASKAARRAHATTPATYLPNDELVVTYYRRNSEWMNEWYSWGVGGREALS